MNKDTDSDQKPKITKTKTYLIVLLMGFVIGGWVLYFQGNEDLALYLLSFVSTVMAIYWWIYLFHYKSREKQAKE